MAEADDWPAEIPLRGVRFEIIAIKKGFDREGRMRYAMRYADGKSVKIVRMQMHRGHVGMSFNTEIGIVAFDFAIENEEEN